MDERGKLTRSTILGCVDSIRHIVREDLDAKMTKDLETLSIMLSDTTYPNTTIVRWVELKADVDNFLRHNAIDIRDLI